MLKITVACVARNFDVMTPPETNERSMEMKDSFVCTFHISPPPVSDVDDDLGSFPRFHGVQAHL
jgi:hypothetical protein